MFGDFALEEAAGDAGLFGDAGRGELVQVAVFVPAAAEVADLEQAFFEQGFEAVVGFAEAYAQGLGQFALGDFRVGVDQAHDAEVGFLGHEAVGGAIRGLGAILTWAVGRVGPTYGCRGHHRGNGWFGRRPRGADLRVPWAPSW